MASKVALFNGSTSRLAQRGTPPPAEREVPDVYPPYWRTNLGDIPEPMQSSK